VFVEKIDDYTVKFTLNEPYAPFLDVLTVGIIPEHIWNNVPSSYFSLAEYNIKPIGSGPYKFNTLTKDKSGTIKSLTLEHFDKYHNLKPLIQKLSFKFYPDFDTAVDALINKNVQGISKLPRKNYEDIAKSDKI
jgi:peptide/nickel transport system substrate-binding protein